MVVATSRFSVAFIFASFYCQTRPTEPPPAPHPSKKSLIIFDCLVCLIEMPNKGANQSKRAITSWLEVYCQQNPTYRRNLMILFKQKKYKHIVNVIKKEYMNGLSSESATSFMQQDNHVIDMMKHIQTFDFSKPKRNVGETKPKDKRSISQVDDSNKDSKSDSVKKLKKSDMVEEVAFDEDDMTSFLDKADDDEMKRFFAVS